MFSFRRKTAWLGVDIGTYLTKVVELVQRGKKVELRRFATVPTPLGALQGGMIMDPGVVAVTLKKALGPGYGHAPRVVTAVAGTGVIVRQVRFPVLPPRELAEAVKWEASSYLPFTAEEAIVDYHVLGKARDGQPGLEVVLAAAERGLIGRLLEAMEGAGVSPEVIDVQPFALQRSFYQELAGGEENIVFIDIGAGTTDLIAFRQGVVRFLRMIPFAGERFTEAIATILRLTFAEAERLKHARARLSTGEREGNPAESRARQAEIEEKIGENEAVSGATLEEIITPVWRELVTEIQRSLEYYQREEGIAAIEKIVLTGGGALLTGLPESLAAILGVPVVLGNPLAQLSYRLPPAEQKQLETLSPLLAVGIGLALREVGRFDD